MKFASLQRAQPQKKQVIRFDGGLNLSDEPRFIHENQLSELQNMRFAKGTLQCRKGLAATKNDRVNTVLPGSLIEVEYRVYHRPVYWNGKKMKIAACTYLEEDSYFTVCVHLIAADGQKTAAGSLNFSRTSEECFLAPQNISFFGAQPVGGGGLFAFVKRQDLYDSDNEDYAVYEINSDFSGWTKITAFYVPTVMINGRGTRYEEARSSNTAYCGTPKMLESLNLLDGKFKAYYTSDGASSCFRLPFSGLASKTVTCRIYTQPNVYWEWSVAANASQATASFFTAQITLHVDRSKGLFYFTDAQDDDYPIDNFLHYHENNICITAYKDCVEGFEEVISSTVYTCQGNKLLFSGGKMGNRIFCCDRTRPLYFPAACIAAIGSDEPFAALEGFKDGVLACKKNETYLLRMTVGKAFNTSSLLADNDSVFYEADRLESVRLSDHIGCENGDTTALCAGAPVWLGHDRRIYVLLPSSKEIKEISSAVSPWLEEFTESALRQGFAMADAQRYILVFGGKAAVAEFRLHRLKNAERKPEQTLWQLYSFGNVDLLGGMTEGDQTCMLCRGSDGNLLYTASFSGETDTDLCLQEGQVVQSEVPVQARLTTCCFDAGSEMSGKIIDTVLLSVFCKGRLTVKINGGQPKVIRWDSLPPDPGGSNMKTLRLIPPQDGTRTFCLAVESDSDLSVGKLELVYRTET